MLRSGAFTGHSRTVAGSWASLAGTATSRPIGVALIAGLELRGLRDAATFMPQYFPTVEDYRGSCGSWRFQLWTTASWFPARRRCPRRKAGVDTFTRAYAAALPVEQRDAYFGDVARLPIPVLCDDQGNWTADYVRSVRTDSNVPALRSEPQAANVRVLCRSACSPCGSPASVASPFARR